MTAADSHATRVLKADWREATTVKRVESRRIDAIPPDQTTVGTKGEGGDHVLEDAVPFDGTLVGYNRDPNCTSNCNAFGRKNFNWDIPGIGYPT